MKLELELQYIAIGDVTIKLFVPQESSVKNSYWEQRMVNAHTPFPYWAKLWPSALALCAFIQKQPQFVRDKEVLELAAGLGLPSLLAARFAHTVCCSDYLPEAIAVMDQSIEANGVTNVNTRLLDWRHLPGTLEPEVLLLSDINYDPQEFEVLYKVLVHFLQKKATILLSTPQRLMAAPFIDQLLPFCIQQEELPINHKGDMVSVSVFVLKMNR
jgi:predicted nicotinamide N-methyase